MPNSLEPSDSASASLIVEYYDQGYLTQLEMFDRLAGLIRNDNIEALIASIPDELRNEFVSFVAHCNPPDSDGIEIFGGIKSWELESDPTRRAELRRADQQHREAERAHYRKVIWPAIRAWMNQRGDLK